MATQDEKIKWVEGSPFMVDGFRFTNPKCRHYLLTHFHSDHTTGLYKSFSAGTIYTSTGTANLIVELMGVNRERVVALPMNTPCLVAGFELTLIDANHCPAAVMFVIRDPRPGGRTTLHTGDFRADESVCRNPVVKSLKGRLDAIYLDTTYCGPRHTFPDQHEVLAQADKLVRVELQRDPNTLFLVGTYSIGKERVLEAVAKATSSRCLVTSRKARTMRLSGAWDDSSYTTHDSTTGGGVTLDGDSGAPWYARVRAVPLQDTNSPATLLGVLAEARAGGAPFTSVVGVRPTGWTHTNVRNGGRGAGGGVQSSIAKWPGMAGGGGGGGGGGEPECPPDERDQDDEAATWGAVGGGIDEDGNEGREEANRNLRDLPPPQPSSSPSSSLAASPQAATAEAWSGKKPWVDGNARVYSLPYSEHSSFTQLKDFVRTVRPKKIVPTVNAASPASVEKMLSHFLEFMDLSSDRKRLDSYFCKRSNAPSPCVVPTSKTVSAPAGKRRKSATGGAAAGPPPSPSSTTGSSHPPQAATRVLENGGGGALNTLQRPPLSPARGEREVVPRPRVVENPYASAVLVGNRHRHQPCASRSGMSVASSAASAAAPVNLGGDSEVDLHLVDVEAQKAILAEIERRQHHKHFEGGRERHGGGEDKTAAARRASPGSRTVEETTQTVTGGEGERGDVRTALHSTVKLTEKRMNAATPRSAGAKRGANVRPADGSRAVEGRTGSGVKSRGIFRTSGAASGEVTGTKTSAVALPERGCDCHQEVLTVDDDEGFGSPADSCSPMDIRDFFSRRG